MSDGRKNDSGKLQYDLLPTHALEEVVDVLTRGASKYEPENWRRVPDAKRRYFNAAMRHMWAWKKGEQFDGEWGLSHLAHAATCLLFILELDSEEEE